MNLGLHDMLLRLTGKWGCGLILAVLLVGQYINVSIKARSYIDIVNSLFLPKTSIPTMLLILIFCSSYVAKRGFETIGRMSWFLFPVIILVVITLVTTTWQSMKLSHLFPLLGAGIGPLLWNGLTHSSVFGEILLLAFFYQYVISSRNFRNGMWIGFLMAVVFFAFFSAIYVMVFDYPAVDDIAYPYQQLTRAASLGSRVAHLESIFLGIWILSAVLHFAIFLYLLAYLFSRLFNIHEFEPLILPLGGLIIVTAGFPKNIIQQNMVRDTIIEGYTFFLILLPILLWGLYRWKERSS